MGLQQLLQLLNIMKLTLIQQVNLTSLTHWIFNLRKPFYYAVQQAKCAVFPATFVRKSTASLQIKISTAQLNFSNRNVIF